MGDPHFQQIFTPAKLTTSKFYLIIFQQNDTKVLNMNQEVIQMKQVTLKVLYKKVTDLQRDVAQIKKTLIEEPDLRDDFILRMGKIDLEKSIPVEDFGKRYGLK